MSSNIFYWNLFLFNEIFLELTLTSFRVKIYIFSMEIIYNETIQSCYIVSWINYIKCKIYDIIL